MTSTTTETCSRAESVFSIARFLETRIKLQIALHSLICKYLLFLAANKKKSSVCWNPQDSHFCINYSFSDGLRPSGAKLLVLSSPQRKAIEQL